MVAFSVYWISHRKWSVLWAEFDLHRRRQHKVHQRRVFERRVRGGMSKDEVWQVRRAAGQAVDWRKVPRVLDWFRGPATRGHAHWSPRVEVRRPGLEFRHRSAVLGQRRAGAVEVWARTADNGAGSDCGGWDRCWGTTFRSYFFPGLFCSVIDMKIIPYFLLLERRLFFTTVALGLS